MTDKVRAADDAARDTARRLIDTATFAAIAVLDPDTRHPSVTRIALATDADRTPVSLISDLSMHTSALRAHPECALLVGEPTDKGDPLTHPRLTLHCCAQFIPQDVDAALRAHYLQQRPKAKLYAGFADFHFVRFTVTSGLLNAGFGKAFKLNPADT